MANKTIYPFGLTDEQPTGIITKKLSQIQDTIDLLAPLAFAETPNPANPIWRDVLIDPRDGGIATLRLGTSPTSNQVRYFLSPLIDLGGAGEYTITFAGGLLTPQNGYLPSLLFFNENLEFQTYYKQNALPRTVTFNSSAERRYIRLIARLEHLFNSYILNSATGEYLFDGAANGFTKGFEEFLAADTTCQLWKPNSRGDFIGYNFTNSDAAASGQNSTYDFPMYRSVGINATPYSFSISKVIKLPRRPINIEFSCGEVDSALMMRLLNPGTQVASYYVANENPRTVSITATYTHVQLYFRTANYANCYIKDADNDVILWQGAESTE